MARSTGPHVSNRYNGSPMFIVRKTMKQANTYKGKLEWQSEFSHRYACWAKNHNGWAKMKKSNKKLAKRRLKQELRKDLQNEKDN